MRPEPKPGQREKTNELNRRPGKRNHPRPGAIPSTSVLQTRNLVTSQTLPLEHSKIPWLARGQFPVFKKQLSSFFVGDGPEYAVSSLGSGPTRAHSQPCDPQEHIASLGVSETNCSLLKATPIANRNQLDSVWDVFKTSPAPGPSNHV